MSFLCHVFIATCLYKTLLTSNCVVPPSTTFFLQGFMYLAYRCVSIMRNFIKVKENNLRFHTSTFLTERFLWNEKDTTNLEFDYRFLENTHTHTCSISNSKISTFAQTMHFRFAHPIRYSLHFMT